MKNRANMSSEEQREFAQEVDCPFLSCMAKAGEPCTPGRLFPQYPHTPRLDLAFATISLEEKVVQGGDKQGLVGAGAVD